MIDYSKKITLDRELYPLSNIDFSIENTITQSGLPVVNGNNSDYIICGIIGVYPFTGSGSIINLNFEAFVVIIPMFESLPVVVLMNLLYEIPIDLR